MASTVKMVSCPTCRKPTLYEDNPHRPFCSKRCRVIDLGAWAEEAYRVPIEESPDSLENTSLENDIDREDERW